MNIPSIVILALIILAVVAILIGEIKKRKSGKGSCSCGGSCGCCPMGDSCHSKR